MENIALIDIDLGKKSCQKYSIPGVEHDLYTGSFCSSSESGRKAE
ncbi:hypothetical protein [Kosakonia sp. S42]|nr:hypothetical protein [Kosakonia sp. S42]